MAFEYEWLTFSENLMHSLYSVLSVILKCDAYMVRLNGEYLFLTIAVTLAYLDLKLVTHKLP